MRLGHSPDADDAFMFYAMAKGKVTSQEVDFEHVIEDIQSLNNRAINNELEVTAMSVHAYIYVQDNYCFPKFLNSILEYRRVLLFLILMSHLNHG